MAHSFLTPDNIYDRWADAKKYTDRLTDPFPEFQRISRNEPYPGGDPSYPNVTDGTTASIIQKTPKRVVQQLPTGVLECEDGEEWLCLVAEDIYLNKIIPHANEDYGLFEKSQLVIENGLTFGFAATYAPFLNHNGYFCPDLTIPYWGDIYIQRGKKSGRSASFVFLRSWWQKEDVEALIDSEKKLQKQAKQRGEEYESTWDIQALQTVADSTTLKDDKAQTPSEDQRSLDTGAIELVTGFQEGVGSIFYTFNPTSKTIVRTKKNKDPRGKMPIDWFYGDMDGTNPFGRGIVELLGGLQNLIDSDMQAYQYNRALALQPPVIKKGNIGSFKFEPNAVIEDESGNGDIIPLKIDTSALVNYPQLYGLQKSQLLNLVSSPDTSISADVGNPGFSKTPAGVNQQRANISVDDNSIRKQFETWFESWSETAINLYFAERTGTEIVQLTEKTAIKLKKLAEQGKFDASLLNDNNQIIINYDNETPVLKFKVDASTSKMADDQAQLAGVDLLVKMLDGSQVLQGIVPQENILELWNRSVGLSGLENPEDVKVDIKKFKEQQAQAQANAANAAAMSQPTTPQLDPDEQRIITHLQQLGVSEAGIQQVIDYLNQGASAEDVMSMLTQGAVNG